ncbi:MAG: RNA-binding cell elongation regulator Jag/EloR [Eubacteriales bacterium]|nr:RNA-binding cell elongation regulator Jag/EloR [Eubacteriales bacterium]
MENKVVVNAKSVEEAVSIGAAQLGVSAEMVEYTVLEEARKGFLGMGATPARVEVIYKKLTEKSVEKAEAAAQTSNADVTLETQPALCLLRTLIEDMELSAQACAQQDAEGTLHIDVNGENAGVLIGHHGETLDALQYLCNLAVNPVQEEKNAHAKVSLDVAGYRAKREATLRALARRTARKVQKYHKNITLEPMNPYERRIIHSEVQGTSGVTTYSVGQGPARRVVVALADGTVPQQTSQAASKNSWQDAPHNPVGHRTPRPAKKPVKQKSVASYFGDEEYTDDYMLDEKGEPLDIAKICGIYEDDPVQEETTAQPSAQDNP